MGQHGLIIFLENAFCRAELALAQKITDNLLQQYINNLAYQMLPMLTAQVEVVMDQPVEATSVTSNISQDWIMLFLQLAKE